MAKQIKRGRKGKKEKVLPFTKTNYLLFGIGLLVIVLGNVFLSIGPWDSFWSLDLAPVLLVIAYLVIIPLAILYHKRNGRSTSANEVNG